MTLKIAVLQGGQSAEAEVSRNSAAQVAQALVSKGHSAELVELDQQCTQQLLALAPDVVFPALHGPPGEDGTVQGYLEILQLPYVGSDVRGSALAMDKAVAKNLFRQAGLPVLADRTVNPQDDLESTSREITATLGRQVVIKPLNQGSAIGVNRLPNGGDIEAALATSLQFGPCLVEPYLEAREMTVGVLDIEDSLTVHPVIEIRTASDEWYDYTNRYQAGKSEHIIPANVSAETTNRLQEVALKAHQCLGLRDLSRADFLVTEKEEIALLEVNSLPGMTPTSLYPDGASHLGYDFPSLMDALVRHAATRKQ